MNAEHFTADELRELDWALQLAEHGEGDPLRRKLAGMIAELEPPTPAEIREKLERRNFAAFLDALAHDRPAPPAEGR